MTRRQLAARGRVAVAAAVLSAMFVVSVMLAAAAGRAAGSLALVAFVPFGVVALFIAAHHPRNRLAWLMLGLVGASLGQFAVSVTLEIYETRLEHPVAVSAGLAGQSFFSLLASSAAFVVLLFPDGRLPTRRWRWVVGVYFVTLTALILGSFVEPVTSYNTPNPVVIPGGATLEPILGVTWAVGVAVLMLSAPFSVVGRWRRARGADRQQYKVVGSAIVALAVLGAMAWATRLDAAFVAWFFAVVVVLPTAIGVAILRYRLYDIDRLVSRTVTYTLVTAVIGLPYLLVVPAVTRVVSSDLAVAVATLTAAAAFNPVRRRVQSRVDRRFNRARYDTAQTIERFSARLRDEVALEDVTRDLVSVVHHTMQPASVSLWLRT